MKPGREFADHLRDILDAAEKIQRFTEGMDFAQFQSDDKTSYAVIRALEIIGEATKRLPDSVRERHPSVPWRDMAGIRDKLIHNYTGISLVVVWKTAREDVPTLKPLIAQVLDEEAAREDSETP